MIHIILVSVTIAAAASTAAPAISLIFAASATGAASFAASGAVFSGVSTAVVKGLETGNIKEALKEATLSASEGFKWGAITGALIGGAKEAVALHGATSNGLKMNEVAKIQKESKYPLNVIKNFNSMNEYNVYKEAGLKTGIVNGKTALIQDID